MGWYFHIRNANIAAYLTTLKQRPPRLLARELNDFLAVLSGKGDQSPDSLFSSSPEWIESVRRSADEARQALEDATEEWNAELSPNEVTTRLASLRPLLIDYNLFGMAIGSWDEDQLLRTFTTYAAIESGHHALFLIPAGWRASEAIRLLDPFPVIALAAEQIDRWPGMVFWSQSGMAAFAPLADATELYHELRPALTSPSQLDRVLDRWRRRSRKASILQLSDLHFGNDWAQEKEPFLSTHLYSISSSVARVVITGDLFDEPQRAQAQAFHSFRATLERERAEEAVVIPGNHDQKWRGNLRTDLGEIGKVEWSSVVVDDQTQCVFFCFDSSRDARLARGKITPEQRVQVATQFDQLCLRRPEIKAYLRVALIHHHPFSFETAKERLISRYLERLGITDEYFLRMDDAKSFLSWCANRKITLILHGHKHVPRYREEWVDRSDGSSTLITTVGCGTSLGAEGKPLSYNVVGWDPQPRRWVVSYFMDPGDGSGFTQEYLSTTAVQND